MEEMKLELNSNIFLKEELIQRSWNVTSLHPAFQMGRKENEHTILMGGCSLKLTESKIRALFTNKKPEKTILDKLKKEDSAIKKVFEATKIIQKGDKKNAKK